MKIKKKRSAPKLEHFFPRIQVKIKAKKKNVFTENEARFSPNSSGDLRSDAHQSQIIEGYAHVDDPQIIEGDTVKLLGDKSPPDFGTPSCINLLNSLAQLGQFSYEKILLWICSVSSNVSTNGRAIGYMD